MDNHNNFQPNEASPGGQNSLAQYFSDESKIPYHGQDGGSSMGSASAHKGPTETGPALVTQTHQQTYYRRPDEPVGQSLYRDHLNRQQRHKIAEFATDIKAKMNRDKKHTAPMSDQLLTDKLEREIDTLLKRWLGKKITHITKKTVSDLLTNLGVFYNYAAEKRQKLLKDMQDRYDKEQEFAARLWEDFLYTTIPSEDLSGEASDEVRLEVFSEVLKVLLSPFMKKNEKVLLLMTIQQLFLNTGSLISEYELMKDIVEPFSVLYGSKIHENTISEMVAPKRDIAKEVYEQCTFKPKTNNDKNNKIAESRYQRDQKDATLARGKSPTNRLHVLYEDGRKNKEMADKMAKDLENLKMKNCTFKPQKNVNYETIQSRLHAKSPDKPLQGETTEAIKLQNELRECSFTPRINRSPVSRAPTSPRGFDETVQRMRIAVQGRSVKKQISDQVGKPKLGAQHFTAEGLTAVVPFQFYTQNRGERIKTKRLEESKSATFLSNATRANSPSESPSRCASSRNMSPSRKRTQPTIPQQQTPPQMSQVEEQPSIEGVKLFDVDVKIAKDKIVRIEMTDQDDPWTISKFFQQQYGMSNEATAALFELLQHNFDTELQKQHFSQIEARDMQFQDRPEPIEEEPSIEQNSVSSYQQSIASQKQPSTQRSYPQLSGSSPRSVTNSSLNQVTQKVDEIVSTNNTHISEVDGESSHSDDDNCDVLSDKDHQSESCRPRF